MENEPMVSKFDPNLTDQVCVICATFIAQRKTFVNYYFEISMTSEGGGRMTNDQIPAAFLLRTISVRWLDRRSSIL